MKINIFNQLSQFNILLIQENKSCNDTVYNFLYEICNKLIQTTSQEEIVSQIEEEQYDIIFIDIALPKNLVRELIKAIRKIDIIIPIIVLSSKENRTKVVESINFLIEGIIVKPLDREKLLEALKHPIRRIEYLKPSQFTLSQEISYFLNTHELMKDGKLISLAKKEVQLLELLIKNIGRIVSIDEIEWELWENEDVGKNALKSVIQRLRKEIGKQQIRSHSGIGYSLERRSS